MSWVSVHVFSQGPLDHMITELAGPLLGDDGFFLRYWEGGPHLRIRVKSHPAEHVVARAEAYLREHPSEAVIDPEEYARLAATLAAREGLSGHTGRLYPNDSVHLIPYRPEHHRYGTGRSLDAAERHFHESSRIALELIRSGLPPARRGAAWLTMLLVAWQVAGEGRMFAPPPGAPVDAPYDEATRARLAALAAHARTVTAQPPPSEPSGVVATWYASIARLAGELAAAGFDARRTGETVDLAAHLLANRLGIRVQEEARLRHLATGAVREPEVSAERAPFGYGRQPEASAGLPGHEPEVSVG
ncbi:thiopeptide-type bacteriocin biosynthesis protein [Nonomuraea sp. NPDC049309]|uniref:thiopeptide-type bacteriocin biosynthesis protein n=1 Tax=Nonomuraea sp. NPDC049309 TaxID=3364350 RepID=UPI00371D5C4E